MHLNHPQTIPPPAWSMEKLSSSKQVLGAKKFGDCSSTTCKEHLSKSYNFLAFASPNSSRKRKTQRSPNSRRLKGFLMKDCWVCSHQGTKDPKPARGTQEPEAEGGTRSKERKECLQRRQTGQKLDNSAQGWEQLGGNPFISLLPSLYLLSH